MEVTEEHGGHGGKRYGQECASNIKERAANRHGDQHHHRVQVDGFGLQQWRENIAFELLHQEHNDECDDGLGHTQGDQGHRYR